MEEIKNKIIKMIDIDMDYKDFYSCSFLHYSYPKQLNFKIEKYDEIEYLFYEFKKKIYYCLQNISIINIILKNEQNINFSKIKIVNNCKKITMYYKNEIIIEIFFEIF